MWWRQAKEIEDTRRKHDEMHKEMVETLWEEEKKEQDEKRSQSHQKVGLSLFGAVAKNKQAFTKTQDFTKTSEDYDKLRSKLETDFEQQRK